MFKFSSLFRRSTSRRQASRRRISKRLFLESLEDRRLLASDCSLQWFDTNLDGFVSPIDALIVINDLHDNGAHRHDAFQDPSTWKDVDYDGWITPLDVNAVVTDLNTNGAHPFVLECPSQEGTLTVVQKSLATTDVVVSNEKNVTLLAFEASADEVQHQLLTSAHFMPSVGVSSNVEKFYFWVDTNDDNVVDTILDKGDANFDNIAGGGYVIPPSSTVRFEVHADIAQSLSGNQFKLAFADSNAISAEALVDGSDLAGITLITTESTLFTLQNNGILAVVKDSTPVRAHQLLGGTLGETSLRLELRSDAEAVDVFYLGVDVVGAGGPSIDRLEAYLPGATSPFAVGTRAAAMTGDNFGFRMQSRQLVVGENLSEDVIIRPRMNTDTDGGLSGDQFALAVDAIMARGDISSNEITPTIATDIVSPTHTVVMAKVTAITNADPNASGTAVPTGVQRQIGQFKFATAANVNTKNGLNKVAVDQLSFVVNSTNVSLDATTFRFYNKADASVKSSSFRLERLDGTAIPASGTVTGIFRVVFTGLDASLVDAEIPQGEDKTFVLETSVLNSKIVSSQTSTLQASLKLDDPSFIRYFDRDNGGAALFNWVEYPETVVSGTSYIS